jgi:hypothetical protein
MYEGTKSHPPIVCPIWGGTIDLARSPQVRPRKGGSFMEDLERVVELLSSIDGTLSAIRMSVVDVDEINALLREILKELKKSQHTPS